MLIIIDSNAYVKDFATGTLTGKQEFSPPAFFPPAFCPSAFFPPQAAILPPVDCDYILSYSIHSLTLLFALLNMLSHCCVVLACSVAPN